MRYILCFDTNRMEPSLNLTVSHKLAAIGCFNSLSDFRNQPILMSYILFDSFIGKRGFGAIGSARQRI